MLTDGFNHVACTTEDLDPLVDFWRSCFDAEVEVLVEQGAPFRQAFVALSPTSMLHYFELDESWTGPAPATPMFRRGRLDHYAIAAADERALLDIRDRVMAAGFSDGTITQFSDIEGFKRLISMFVIAPDGCELEVACLRTDDVVTDDMVVDFVPPVHAEVR
jgi:catechol 2,3-dioxygenase-like lactoylglutathione lyase family enzyme